MRKTLMLLAVAGLFQVPVFAAIKTASGKPTTETPTTVSSTTNQESKCVSGKTACTSPDKGYEIIQIGLWFDQPTNTKETDVYGVKVGAPICSGNASVNGIETAVICGATREVNGLSACILWSDVNEMTGIQFSIVNFAKKVSGFQLGIVNVACDSSLQLGILNFNKNGFLPVFPILNFGI